MAISPYCNHKSYSICKCHFIPFILSCCEKWFLILFSWTVLSLIKSQYYPIILQERHNTSAHARNSPTDLFSFIIIWRSTNWIWYNWVLLISQASATLCFCSVSYLATLLHQGSICWLRFPPTLGLQTNHWTVGVLNVKTLNSSGVFHCATNAMTKQ